MNQPETDLADAPDVGAEILRGEGLAPAAAARLAPPSRNGCNVAPQTLVRWIVVGVRMPDGKRVRLEGKRLGGTWFTTAAALQRFMDAQTPDLSDDETEVTPRPKLKREKAAEQAGRELEKAGV